MVKEKRVDNMVTGHKQLQETIHGLKKKLGETPPSMVIFTIFTFGEQCREQAPPSMNGKSIYYSFGFGS